MFELGAYSRVDALDVLMMIFSVSVVIAIAVAY